MNKWKRFNLRTFIPVRINHKNDALGIPYDPIINRDALKRS